MKYLILLLFTPFLCFSQITLQEILAIDSETTFKRTMIENGFFREDNERPKQISYRKNTIDDVPDIITTYNIPDSISSGNAMFMFVPNRLQKNDTYDRIYDLVKKECGFIEIRNHDGVGDFAYYKCADIDPDPRLIEIQDLYIKNIKSTDKPVQFTDIEIGFSKLDSFYVINLPISGINIEKYIETLTRLYKMGLETQKMEEELNE